jgi:polysaccharide export outer membrane protein
MLAAALAVLLMQLAACAGPPRAPMELPGTVLQAGDRLYVEVYNEPGLSREVVIESAGTAVLPLTGALPLAGLTLRQAERRVADALSPAYLRAPAVAIRLLERRPFYVLGEVRRPGRYAFTPGMTVLQAVAVAGGFTYRAREREVTIVRRAPDGQWRELAGTRTTPLKPGDTVQVHERYY